MDELSWRERWTREQIRAMLVEQFDAFWNQDTGIVREKLSEVEKASSSPHAVIVSGLRRVGKSTLLLQMARRLGKDAYYYVNFEDDRLLGFKVDDADYLYQTLVELFGERKTFILDEIQNVTGWEHFVRRFMDLDMKFYITGSNASLLSRELGTRLTGRYIPIELFPFSFQEYMKFMQIHVPQINRMTTVERARLNSSLMNYLNSGGIPDVLKYPELPLLRTLYDDVLYRDIATRYGIDGVSALKSLAFALISNPAGKVTFNKLKEQFKVGSLNTITNYIDYMENSWLLFTINCYDHSLKRQQVTPKKVYCIDTGLAANVGFNFSPNSGKLLENLIFLALRRRTKEIYYLTTKSGLEVDFYLPEQAQAIQVSQNLKHEATREREIRAFEDAARIINVREALILTEENEPEIIRGDITIKVRSIAEWLLEQSE